MAAPQNQNSTGLNVIALISGGKDSLYSILHCIKNGHKVVALANLHPALKSRSDDSQDATRDADEEEEEDIDSFMYQTIGHSVIPLYESALGIPLYRAPITGGAIDTSRIYRHDAADQMKDANDQNADETESLVPLLRRIMKAHPEANAVSAGAILSTYQRTRIENVASRLGLVPLAWLWQYPVLPAPKEREELSRLSPAVGNAGLLEDMAACGCEARIIKVASGGLDDSFLWGDVASADGDMRRRIVKGMKRFVEEDLRGAVLGEGGEYETLALDGPGFLWKQKIEIEQKEVGVGGGGVGFMRLKGAKCVPKNGEEEVTPESVRRPAFLDDRFACQLNGLSAENYEGKATEQSVKPDTRLANRSIAPVQLRQDQRWTISNITAPEAGPGAGEQMEAIANKAKEILKLSATNGASQRSTEDIVFATVLLRSMADFALINSVYVSLFKKPNPPARATVACGDSLPEGVNVMVSFVVDMGARDLRQGLHVQSRSYWAPANIGPYSQAISVPLDASDRLVYIAGQIPLDPASMEIARVSQSEEQTWFGNYSLRAVLSLQHLWRIGAVMQVDWWAGAVAFLAGDERIEIQARVAWELWEKVHARKTEDDDEDDEPVLDAWDIKYGRRADEQTSKAGQPTPPNFDVVESLAVVPPFFAVQVEELPRGSDIEWQSAGIRCRRLKMAQVDTAYGRRVDALVDESVTFSGIEVALEESGSCFEGCIAQAIASHSQEQVSQAVIYTAQAMPEGLWQGQIVPCKSVWGAGGRRLAAGITLQLKR